MRSSWFILVGPNPNDKCPFLRHSKGTENKGESSWGARGQRPVCPQAPGLVAPPRGGGPGKAERTLWSLRRERGPGTPWPRASGVQTGRVREGAAQVWGRRFRSATGARGPPAQGRQRPGGWRCWGARWVARPTQPRTLGGRGRGGLARVKANSQLTQVAPSAELMGTRGRQCPGRGPERVPGFRRAQRAWGPGRKAPWASAAATVRHPRPQP